MSSLSLRLPDSLHQKIRELAEQDHVSINQFIATAVAEKAAALLTVEYIEERGRRADPGLLDRILRRVPDVPAAPGDEMPAGSKRAKKAPQLARRTKARGRRSPKARARRGRSRRPSPTARPILQEAQSVRVGRPVGGPIRP